MKTEKVSAVVDTMNKCCICGNPHVQIHHIFYGTANRIHSDHYNLIVPLCLAHHTGTNGVHNNNEHLNNNMVMKNSWPYLAKTTCREGYYELYSGNQ